MFLAVSGLMGLSNFSVYVTSALHYSHLVLETCYTLAVSRCATQRRRWILEFKRALDRETHILRNRNRLTILVNIHCSEALWLFQKLACSILILVTESVLVSPLNATESFCLLAQLFHPYSL